MAVLHRQKRGNMVDTPKWGNEPKWSCKPNKHVYSS